MESDAYHEMFQLEAAHWWYRGMRDITAVLLKSLFPASDRLKILDAGCGTGFNLKALATFGEVTGVDFSSLAVGYARQYGKVAQASIEHLPYPTDYFDLVTSFEVIYHVGVRDDVRAIREMARVAHPGGYVLVRVPALSALKGAHDVFVHGVRRYTVAELQAKLQAAGLIPVRLTYANSLLLPAIFLARQWHKNTPQGRSDVQYQPGMVSEMLYRLLRLEGAWINRGGHFAAGVSLFGVGQKPLSESPIATTTAAVLSPPATSADS